MKKALALLVAAPLAALAVALGASAPPRSAASTAPTFASETSYTQTRPTFTVKRTVSVSSGTALKAAIASLRPGDLVRASAPFTVTHGGTGDTLIISNRLSAPAEIDLTGVKIVYTGTAEFGPVWIKNVLNVWIFGGDVSETQGAVGGGSCISWAASQHSIWWGFHAHDCGSGGLGVFTSNPGYSFAGPISYDDIEGSVTHFSLNHGKYDPHAEKCSGVHGANVADNNQFAVDHNRIALDVEDSSCTGGGISFGSSKSPTTSPSVPVPTSNTVILKCVGLTFVSVTQTGGNCYQTWGYGNRSTDVKYVEATDLTGHAYWAGGLYSKTGSGATALATDTVDYGRATNIRQNPRYARDKNWDTTGSTVFQDVAPLP